MAHAQLDYGVDLMWLAWVLVVYFCAKALAVQLKVGVDVSKAQPVKQGVANVVTMISLGLVAAIVWVWM
jgi:hypothetical protein